jgi:hypothetical protein
MVRAQGFVAIPKGGGDASSAKRNAVEAAKSLEEYLRIHYSMLRDFGTVDLKTSGSSINIDDVVHYHVYGDYRLLTTEVLGPRPDHNAFQFTEADMIAANKEDLAEYIQEITTHYNTTPSVMTPYMRVGVDGKYEAIPLLRFKTTNYHANIRVEEANNPRLHTRLLAEGHGVYSEGYMDQLNGFFGYEGAADQGPFVKGPRSHQAIMPRMSHWANNQLHAGTQATRFFLPSLGTMLVSGDITKLANYVGGRLDFIIDDLVENAWDAPYNFLREFNYRTPEELQDEYGPLFSNNNIARDLNSKDIEDAPRIFYEWARHICAHPDYRMYLEQTLRILAQEEIDIIDACGGSFNVCRNPEPSTDTKVTRPSVIFRIAKEATQAHNISKAGENFIKQLLNQGREPVGVGTAVKLTDRGERKLQDGLDALNDLPVDDDENRDIQNTVETDDTFYISAIENQNYQLTRNYEGDVGTLYFPMNPDNSPDINENHWFPKNNFEVYDEDEGEIMSEETKRDKNIGGKIDPLHKVFMRIVMDVYMTFETFASISTNNIGWKKFTKQQNKNQDRNLRKPYAGGGDGGKSSLPIGEFLAEQRLEINLGKLASEYASNRANVESVKQFYSQDLLGAEVQWLSNSISDFLPTLVSEMQGPSNLLVQEMYIPPEDNDPRLGTITDEVGQVSTTEDRNVDYARVRPEVIFLRLDSALLRDIFIEYTKQHNSFIAGIAKKSGKKGKKNRKGQKGKNQNQSNKKILPTMWVLLKEQAVSVASTEGLKPHIMWNIILDAVDNYRSTLTMQYPLVPEHWATTFTVANLRKDPGAFGESIDTEQQGTLLSEYLLFLETTYYNSFDFIAAISSALDKIRITLVSDLNDLKRFFVERLHEDSKYKILGREFWPAYQRLLYIMRSFADIPPGVRGEYTAQHFDERAREQMAEGMQTTPGSQGAEPVYGRVSDVSPKRLRQGEVVRRPGM